MPVPAVRRLLLAAAPLAAAATLTWAVGPPAPVAAGRPDEAVVAAAGLAAWLCACWLALAVAVTAAGTLPGAAGAALAAVSRRITPVAVRRAVEAALGATLVAGPLTGAAAAAEPPRPQPAATLDWPGLAPAPRTGTVALVTATATAEHAGDATVVVRRGDTLWHIAARHLGPGAGNAEIAAEWPRWYAANRAVIGADPDLIRPGQRLVPPTR